MSKGNVLLVGNSGVGKSTLINAVLGDDYAVTGYGEAGTTSYVQVYDEDQSPFALVDTAGFEPGLIKESNVIGGIKKWSAQNAKDGNPDNDINVIWFCVDGMASKLFPKTLRNLVKATSVWKSVPIIVVITKSYSALEQEKNIDMVSEIAQKDKYLKEHLAAIIPVVAQELPIDETFAIAPSGIGELIEATEEVMPEGREASKKDVDDFVFGRKRALGQGVIAGAAASAAAVGFAPLPFADAMVLGPIELAMTSALAKLYGVGDDEKRTQAVTALVEAGTAGVAAKAAISGVKAIPGLNIATAPLNAAVAGGIVVALGEAATLVFEGMSRGDAVGLVSIQEIVDRVFDKTFIGKMTKALEDLMNNPNSQQSVSKVIDVVLAAFGIKK